MVLQQLLFQPNWERRSKIWCRYISTRIEFWNQFKRQHLLASNVQIFMTVYLHINSNISTVVKYLWLLLSSCSLSYYSSSACLEVLQLCVWAISSSFYFGHKSFKASIRPKSFNYIISHPTTNPIHPPWLITKPSWFIRSTSCGYEPKITLTSSSKRS